MDKLREECYQEDAAQIEESLKQQGFLDCEVAIVGFMLLNKHINALEEYIELTKRSIDLIKKAEQLLKDF
jgi:hypothetical protein